MTYFFTTVPYTSWTASDFMRNVSWTMPKGADPKDKYEVLIPDGEVPPNEGPEPTEAELEDSGDDPAEVEE